MMSVWSGIISELRQAIVTAVPTVPAERVAFAVPPDAALGDIAVPCFSLAKEIKQSPAAIAACIVEALAGHPLVASATVMGPYANIRLDHAALAERTLTAVLAADGQYGDALAESRERVVIEYVSPNTNKPLHLGHLRNAFLGAVIARLLDARGHKVRRVCLVNDRGIHIMKSMLAYVRWGQKTTPDSEGIKGDHFVGNWYVVFDQKNKAQRTELGLNDEQPTPLEEEIAELLRKWEARDPEIRALWQQMNAWTLDGHQTTYERIGIAFDRQYFESAISERGRDIVREGIASGKLIRDARGNAVAPLESFGLPDKIVERADGTTVYATQDLALAAEKDRDLHPDRSIILTGNEQDLYFRQLFAIFQLLDIPGAERYAHRSYGMVMLPGGKMKSREGTVVDADDLVDQLTALAEAEIRSRADAVAGEAAAGTDEPPVIVSDAALARAKDIALAALKFYLLLVTPETTVTFDPKASLAFSGKTGPYLQYMHARICSMLRRAASLPRTEPGADRWALLAHPAERKLLVQIARFPDVVATAADALDPSTLAQFCYDLAHAFSAFYRDVPVLKADGTMRDARLAFCEAVRIVLARGLTMLGITPLEEM